MHQVNETLLRSMVTQPWNENYVYAWNFSSLSLVKNVVLSKACRIIDFPTTTMTSLTPTAVTPSGIGYAKRCYDRNDSAISINCQNLA